MNKAKKIIFYFYLTIGSVILFLFFTVYFEYKSPSFGFYVFDVGQGDSILIRTPNRYNILIDGGSDNKVVYKLGEYLPFYERQIDLMILTHPHADHIIGLVEVLNRYKVKKIFTTGVLYSSSDYFAWLDKIREKNIPLEIIDQQRIFSLNDGVELEIFFPNLSLESKKINNLNNASIVFKLIYRDIKILLAGDYEDEESLVKTSLDLSADILKVGHHGSDTANSYDFLKAVNPNKAVISCGENNKFGHPHKATVDSLKSLRAEIFQTNLSGDFVFEF